MRVQLLWWQGCPSFPDTLADLQAALAELGLDPAAVEPVEIPTDEDALRESFPGSPTIRVDGRDLFEPGEADQIGLSCRVYRLRDGRPSPTPDPHELREALARVTTTRS
jgi:hypothetical protein